MFTEQPAPPQPVAQIQLQSTDVAAPKQIPAIAAASKRVAPPETLLPQSSSQAESSASVESSSIALEPTPLPSRAPASGPASLDLSTNKDAIAKRKQEIEQALIEITSKAQAQQKERAEQQAAANAAKYAGSGDFDQALQEATNLKLPEDVRKKLLSRIEAKQAQADKVAGGKKDARAKTAQARLNGAGIGRIAGPEYASSPRFASQPILPMAQAELRFRLGKLLGRGNLSIAFPLAVPAPITSVFGWRIHPISGTPRFHRGIDLGAPYGSPVVAAKAGRVETADVVDGYGQTVILQHTSTQQTLYAHLSQILVQPGEWVKQGQLLGLVGSTGFSTGPHLHFEVHEMTSEGWVALDPAAVLNQAIAIAQNSLLQTKANQPGLRINLAVSGVLDVNAPDASLSPLAAGDALFSGIFSTAWKSQAPAQVSQPGSQPGLLTPFTLLPPALPELSWLISPLFDNLLADQINPLLSLPGLAVPLPPVSFSVLSALQSSPSTVAFQPGSRSPLERWNQLSGKESTLRIANTRPLASLTIAAHTPGALRPTLPTPWRKEGQGSVTTSYPSPSNLTTLRLTDKRLQSLKPNLDSMDRSLPNKGS